MPTPSLYRCRQPDVSRGAAAPRLQDLIRRHAEPLAQLLRQHLATAPADGGAGFDAAAAHWRERGSGPFSSWLYGIALGLLREADAAPASWPAGAGFLDRFTQAMPPEVAKPLLALARSELDAAECALYLCKPGPAAERLASLAG